MNNSILCISATNLKSTEGVTFKTFVMQFVNRSYTKHVTRQQLKKLDQQQLNDIGMSVTDARKEANKAFWQ